MEIGNLVYGKTLTITCEREVTVAEFSQMIDHCISSLKG